MIISLQRQASVCFLISDFIGKERSFGDFSSNQSPVLPDYKRESLVPETPPSQKLQPELDSHCTLWTGVSSRASFFVLAVTGQINRFQQTFS